MSTTTFGIGWRLVVGRGDARRPMPACDEAEGSQVANPHLEDSTTYHPLRPTKLDKIKNFCD